MTYSTTASSLKVQVKKLPHGKDLSLPFYATPGSAGLDLMAALEKSVTLKPGERALLPTGISLALVNGYEAQIRPRSGLAFKQGVTVLNTPGTIDADYRGEIKVILINFGQEDVLIERGMRIAQMIITPYVQAQLEEVTAFDDQHSTRGIKGFGSTGLFTSE